MYKRPPKHIQRARLAILYSIMTVAVVLIVAILVLSVSNYRYNRETGTLEQRGLVQFGSTPSGATIEIDGKVIASRTSAKSPVEAGERRFAVWRDGYQAWNLTTPINAGDLVWLNYIRLVPNERPVQELHSYSTLHASLASPSKRLILVQPDEVKPEFRLVDIAHETPTAHMIQLPARVHEQRTSDDSKEDAKKQTSVTYALGQWDESSRYVMIWRHEGSAAELIVLDTRDPSRTVNVSRDFSLPIHSAAFSGRSGNVLYVVGGDNLRRVNVAEGTISRSLIANVDNFSLYGTDMITYTSRADEATGVRSLGIYREGDKEPTILREVAQDDASPVSVAASKYYDTMYTAVAQGSKVDLYTGHYDDGVDALKLVASRTVSGDVDSVEFNETGSHLLVRSKKGSVTYSIERKTFSDISVSGGDVDGLFWFDSMHLGLISDGMLTMRDVDGSNVFELNEAKVGQAATLSRNGTYLYSFGEMDGRSVSQRIRMIL